LKQQCWLWKCLETSTTSNDNKQGMNNDTYEGSLMVLREWQPASRMMGAMK
jgi:hypothetical protein